MRGLQKDTGFLINIGDIDGLKTVLKYSNIIIRQRTIRYAHINDLTKTVKTLQNPKNLTKIKFVLVKITDWTLLNCSLTQSREQYKEFFSLLKRYPHKVFIYQKNLSRNYSSVDTLNALNIHSFHLLDYIIFSRFYRRYLDDPEVRGQRYFEYESKYESYDPLDDDEEEYIVSNSNDDIPF